MTHAVPRVGVGVLVLHRAPSGSVEVLVGQRSGSSHGHGTLQLPGGHLELHEEWAECAVRELAEETGIEAGQLAEAPRFLTATNSPHLEGKHYITVFMGADVAGPRPEAQLLEPEKCAGWAWVPLEWLVARASPSAAPGRTDAEAWSAASAWAGSAALFEPLSRLLRERRDVVDTLLQSAPGQ